MAGLRLFLIRVVCWASEQLWRAPRRPRVFALIFIAFAAMDGATVIGFVGDETRLVYCWPPHPSLQLETAQSQLTSFSA